MNRKDNALLKALIERFEAKSKRRSLREEEGDVEADDDTLAEPEEVEDELDLGDEQPEEDPEQETADTDADELQAVLDQQNVPPSDVNGADQAPDVAGDVGAADDDLAARDDVEGEIAKALDSISAGDLSPSDAMSELLAALDIDVPAKSVEQDTEEEGAAPGVVGSKVDRDTTGGVVS